MDEAALAFYATQGPVSRLPAAVKAHDIPHDLAEMRAVVQGLLVHRDWVKAYGLAAADVRLDEQNIRSVADLLIRAWELAPDPITTPRPPVQRVQGICRHFALLHVALLRAHGVPARMRCGFGGYFDASEKWYDHWITERWDGDRWVRDDPQIDDLQASIIQPDFDISDQPPGKFLSANEAWTKVRAGELEGTNFGIFDMWGPGFVLGNVISDFACLNRMEMLPWDFWSPLGTGPTEVSDADAAVIDELCALVVTDDVGAMRERYATDPRLRVPSQITTMIQGEPVSATIDLD